MSRFGRGRSVAAGAVAVGLALSVTGPSGTANADPLGEVTSFSFSPGHFLRDIAPGPDGAMWFTQGSYDDHHDFDRVGRVTADGVTFFADGISRNSDPFAIAEGPDGNMWITQHYWGDLAGIARITPDGVVSEYRGNGLSPFSGPRGIAAGPDGAMWFVEAGSGSPHAVAEIDVTTGAVTEYPSAVTPGSSPSSIAAGPDGNMWFTEDEGAAIGRVATDGTPVAPIPLDPSGTSAARPGAITTGPDGRMWFVDSPNGRIGAVTAAGTVTWYGGLTYPTSITAGPDGAMWVFEGGAARLARVTTAGDITRPSIALEPATQSMALAPGTDGNLWFLATSWSTGDPVGTTGKIGIGSVTPPADADADIDGVSDAVDSDGGAGTGAPGTFADDTGDGSSTTGQVVDAAGLTVTVSDEGDPKGVRVATSGTGGPAMLSVCAGFTLEVPAGTSVVVTCGSVTVETVAGGEPVTVRPPGSIVTLAVPTGSAATMDTAGSDGFTVDNVTGPVTLTVDGVRRDLAAGDSVDGKSWAFVGFASPVDSAPLVNSAKAGRSVPLKWRLLDAHGHPVTTLGGANVSTQRFPCSPEATLDSLEETAAGTTSLQNLGDGYYQLNWKTPKAFAGSCQTLQLDVGDGVTHDAAFQFTR